LSRLNGSLGGKIELPAEKMAWAKDGGDAHVEPCVLYTLLRTTSASTYKLVLLLSLIVEAEDCLSLRVLQLLNVCLCCGRDTWHAIPSSEHRAC
jgi:hypothetical protein